MDGTTFCILFFVIFLVGGVGAYVCLGSACIVARPRYYVNMKMAEARPGRTCHPF